MLFMFSDNRDDDNDEPQGLSLSSFAAKTFLLEGGLLVKAAASPTISNAGIFLSFINI